MLSAISLSITQALQMVALAPCLIVIFYLIFSARDLKIVIIPILYFLSLSLGILYFLLPAFTGHNTYPGVNIVFLMGDVLIPALSFLLILKLILNRVPPILYWIILIVPAIASTPFVYNTAYQQELCLTLDICLTAEQTLHLNHVIISSFIFILLILIVARRSREIIGDAKLKKYKYWLVISLILYNIVLLALDLGRVDGSINLERYIFAKTMVKIAFIYMVMTSIFRVFTDLFDIRHAYIKINKGPLTEYEHQLATKVKHLFEDKKIYRQIGLNREQLAKIMGIGEHVLSKVINVEFKKSFSDIANEYRIKEAKEQLSTSHEHVTTISFNVGFNSIASFNRVFKQYTGKSPSKYREDMKKEII